MNPLKILAISGSLRSRSTNTDVLRAAAMLAAPRIDVTLYNGLGALPHFNPDLDFEGAVPPPPIQDLRDRIERADALLICSPEYAHGVPGSLKNALDWLVSSPVMVQKPIGLLHASTHSSHAIASLAETLRTMSTRLVPATPVELAINGRRLSAQDIAADVLLAGRLRQALDALAVAVAHGHDAHVVR